MIGKLEFFVRTVFPPMPFVGFRGNSTQQTDRQIRLPSPTRDDLNSAIREIIRGRQRQTSIINLGCDWWSLLLGNKHFEMRYDHPQDDNNGTEDAVH